MYTFAQQRLIKNITVLTLFLTVENKNNIIRQTLENH